MKFYKYENNSWRRTVLSLKAPGPEGFIRLAAETYSTTANANPEPVSRETIHIPREAAIELALDILRAYGQDIPHLKETV